MKNETEVVLRLSSNMIGDNETNFQIFAKLFQIIYQLISITKNDTIRRVVR